jgi:alpha-glucosidase
MMDERPGRMTVGELGDEDIFARQKEYTAGTDRLHTAYGFQLLDARAPTPALFARTMAEWQGESGWPAWSLSNHDVDRYPSRLAGDDPALTRLLLAALLALRGTAFLYQGDELGLPQGRVPFEKLRDPFAKAVWTGGAFRDGARTPMPWTAEGPSAGFSQSGETWLPLDPAHRPLAAEAQDDDPASMLAFTRTLVAIRRNSPALKRGDAEVVPAPEGVFALARIAPQERVLCVFNLSNDPTRIEAPRGGQVMLSLNAARVTDEGFLDLPAHGGALIRVPR